MTTSDDASHGGCSFHLKARVEAGNIVKLDLPLPKPFRRYDIAEASYTVYALVRKVVAGEGDTRVGVMFLGKKPPKGFEKNPGGYFLLPTDPAPARARKERRRHSRLEIHVNLRLKTEDPPREELTIAENVGRGGARVLTSLPVGKGDVVLVEEVGGSFRARAEIKNVYIGEDKIPRLNLAFLDAEAPDSMVASG
jgi:hypothetical protein